MTWHGTASAAIALAAVIGLLTDVGRAQAQSHDKVGLSLGPTKPIISFSATDADDLPETLQDSFSFGEIGPPDLQIRTDAGYKRLLDQAAHDVATSPRAEPGDYVLVSHDSDN
jgi:hypothetical protein